MPKAVAQKTGATAKVTAKKSTAKRKGNGYQMPERIPIGTILTDLSKQQWKIGPSIGVGGFGEIYCACKANEAPKKHEDYQYVVKVEPHGNGPLFVEMHFYMRNGKLTDIEAFRKKRALKSLGMPHFVGHGSHELNQIKHRFIVMPRFGADIWNIFMKNDSILPLHTVYRLAIQMLDVYEYIHDCTYVHGDLKGSNMLLGFGKTGHAQTYLVDFGLASHYTTKDFKPDPKKMHNGTIEYTSRDAHQGVPTMRGDLEILAYNLIQWAGGNLPWKTNNLLGNPAKVQEAKEKLMNNIDKHIGECFDKSACPPPILAFMKLVAKLNYDQKPQYDDYRKQFERELQSLGKTNSGDLEFKTVASPPPKEQKKGKRTTVVDATKRENAENVSPKARKATPKKRCPPLDDEDAIDNAQSPSKKQRGNAKATSQQIVPTQNTGTKMSTDPKIVVHSTVNGTKSAVNKTYEVNFELDISFDANVIVSVKRKSKKSPRKKTVDAKTDRHQLNESTDEIPATEKSFAVGTAKVYKRGVRTSPRGKK